MLVYKIIPSLTKMKVVTVLVGIVLKKARKIVIGVFKTGKILMVIQPGELLPRTVEVALSKS